MDKGGQIDNLYLINGHFSDCIKNIMKKGNLFEKMRIVFHDELNRAGNSKINAFDHVNIHF